MARTAVVAGTATAVSGNVARRQQARAQAAAPPVAAPPVAAPVEPTPPPAAAGTGDDVIGQLERLADLKANGMLDEAEYAAAKARLLS